MPKPIHPEDAMMKAVLRLSVLIATISMAGCATLFVEKHTLTYDANGADQSAVPVDEEAYEVDARAIVKEPLDAETEGMVFVEWNVRADGEGSSYQPGDTFRLGSWDRTLYAQWGHSVTLDMHDGRTEQAVVIHGTSIRPMVPSRDGFAFGGWYHDPELNREWNSSQDIVTSDITLYAKWMPVFTVHFDSNGGSRVGSQTVVAGDYAEFKVSTMDPPQKLDGWYTSDGEQWTFRESPVTEDIYLTARWRDYRVGDYAGAGYVFYDKGEYSNEWRYLAAFWSDSLDRPYAWGPSRSIPGGTDTRIGAGIGNTHAIREEFFRSDDELFVAAISYDGVGTGEEWFVPSRDELVALFENREAVPRDFENGYYWSSSEAGRGSAYAVHFGTGEVRALSRREQAHVRFIYSF